MKVSWLNGGLLLEPETPVESEAMLVLLASVSYELPAGYCVDGRHQSPQTGDSGSVERGDDMSFD